MTVDSEGHDLEAAINEVSADLACYVGAAVLKYGDNA